MSHAAHAHQAYDELDPHGAQEGHHGHHIVGWKTQITILGILLFFTALTVGVSQGEIWIANTWDLHIPNWVNIVGAMSIATVKAVLVCMFFMQLKYDKALNSIVLLFSIFCVGLFLFFSMVDLGNRDRVATFKDDHAVEGGTGEGLANSIAGEDKAFELAVAPKVSTGGKSLVVYRRERAMANWPYKPETLPRGDDKEPIVREDGSLEPGVPVVDYTKEKYAWARKYFEDPYYYAVEQEVRDRGFWHYYYEKTYLRAGKTPHHNPADKNHYYNSFVHDFEHELHEAGLHAHVEHGAESSAHVSRGRSGMTAEVDRLLNPAADHHGSGHGEGEHPEGGHAGDDHDEPGAHTEHRAEDDNDIHDVPEDVLHDEPQDAPEDNAEDEQAQDATDTGDAANPGN